MTLNDRENAPIYLSKNALFAKPIRSVEQLYDLILKDAYTIVVYEDGTNIRLNLADDDHDTLVDLVEEHQSKDNE